MENRNIATLREIIKTLHMLCHSKFPGIIRLPSLPNKGIKFTLQSLNIAGVPSLTLGEISQKGLELLQDKSVVHIEIAGLRQRLKFSCVVMSAGDGHLLVSIPASLAVEERRISARYATSLQQCAYISVNEFDYDSENILHPPAFAIHQKFSSWLMIRNLSQTGVLLETIFPAVWSQISSNKKLFEAKIILAGNAPLDLCCQTKWFKRVREIVEDGEHGDSRNQHKYQVGCAFMDPSEKLQVSLAGFINQLSVSAAI